MKSKAEILKAVDTCIFLGGSCCDCPYFDELDCVNQISKDLHALLNKSDFDIMCDVLAKSETTLAGEYTAMSGHKVIEIHPRVLDENRALIRFDNEGNIL